MKLDLTAYSEEEGFEYQQRFSELIRTRLSPKMEAIFDEFGNEQNIRIEHLELEVLGVEAENWEEDFIMKFTEQLRSKLKQLKSDSTSSPTSTLPLKFSEWLSFLFYLKNGIFPWHSNNLTVSTLDNLVKKEIESKISLQKLESQIRSDFNSLERLIHQLPNSTLEVILKNISEANISFLPFYKILENTYSKWFDKNKIKLEIWKLAFSLLWKLESSKIAFENKFQLHIITSTIEYFSTKKLKIKARQKIEDYLFNELKSAFLDSNITLSKSVKILFQQKRYQKKSFLKKNISIKTPPLPSNPIEKSNSINKIMEEGIFMKNAGLIILWPYLKLFFERIDLVENDDFKNEHKQNQAPLILEYLATERFLVFENELVLNKILCNIPLEKPISIELSLEQNQIEMCESLLNAVIHNWGKLGDTSIQALRETFINRNGKLTKKENGDWSLIVESKPFDILLSSLPWAINVVKLPWMEQKIMVTWH